MLYHWATWEVLESPEGAFKTLAAPDTCQTRDIRMSRHWIFQRSPGVVTQICNKVWEPLFKALSQEGMLLPGAGEGTAGALQGPEERERAPAGRPPPRGENEQGLCGDTAALSVPS